MLWLWDSIKLYLLWALIHYTTTNLYQHYCAGRTLMGFVTASLNSQMPHCKALGWLHMVSVKTLDNYWTLFLSYLIGKITGILGGVQ